MDKKYLKWRFTTKRYTPNISIPAVWFQALQMQARLTNSNLSAHVRNAVEEYLIRLNLISSDRSDL